MKNRWSVHSRTHTILEECKLTKNVPSNAQNWDSIGKGYNILNRYAESAEAFRQALYINPENSTYLYFLGIAYFKLGRYTEAVETFRQALHIDPDDYINWNYLGKAYYKLHLYAEAVEAFRQTLHVSGYDMAWYGLGVTLEKLHRYAEAIEAYRQFISSDAMYIEMEIGIAYYNLGAIYCKLGYYANAIEVYHQAMDYDSEDTSPWNNIVIAHALSGNRTAALAAVRELCRHDPERAEKLFNLIETPDGLKKTEECKDIMMDELLWHTLRGPWVDEEKAYCWNFYKMKPPVPKDWDI